MEPTQSPLQQSPFAPEPVVSASAPAASPNVCPTCHQPVLASYYFCPNCGTKLQTAPLSTTPWTQSWIYFFSIILPMICYLFVTRWPGIKYLRSKDEKAKKIGVIACVLLTLSTIVTVWLAFVWTQEAIQSSVSSINAEMSP